MMSAMGIETQHDIENGGGYPHIISVIDDTVWQHWFVSGVIANSCTWRVMENLHVTLICAQ